MLTLKAVKSDCQLLKVVSLSNIFGIQIWVIGLMPMECNFLASYQIIQSHVRLAEHEAQVI